MKKYIEDGTEFLEDGNKTTKIKQTNKNGIEFSEEEK